MNANFQRWCAWSIVPFIAIYIVAFVGIARFVPPHAPALTGMELTEFYSSHRLSIRVGMLICLVCSALILLWSGAISAQMAQIEGGCLPMLSLIQYGAAVVLVVFFMACNLIWSVAAYREDIDPAMLRMLNDAGWLVFVMAYPEYVVQLACIAAVGFSDKRPRPFMPRWFCAFTLWVAFVGIGGGFATFFTTGPFAWNGLIGFWAPVGIFLIWLSLMFVYLLKAINRPQAHEARHV